MANKKYLDYDGLAYLWSKIIAKERGDNAVTVSSGSTVTEMAFNSGSPLSFVQGSNITLTPNATNKTITISADAQPESFTNVTWDSTAKALKKTLSGSTSSVLAFTAGTNISLTASSTGLTINANVPAETFTNISWDSSNLKLQKTISGTTTDVVTFGNAAMATIATTYDASNTTQPVTGAIVASAMSASGLTKFTGVQTDGATIVPAGTASDSIDFITGGAISWAVAAKTGGVTVTPSINYATLKTGLGLGTAAYQAYSNIVTGVAKTSNANTITVTKGGSSTTTIATGAAAWKGVDTTIAASSTSTNLPTTGAVVSYVTGAIGELEGIKFEVVASLPATGESSTIYLVSNSGSNPNSYDEYIWLSSQSKFEKIGTTDVDLTNYMTYTAYNALAMSTTDIDAALAAGEAL